LWISHWLMLAGLLLVLVLGLRRQNGRGMAGVLLLHMRLRAGGRGHGPNRWACILGGCLIAALEVWGCMVLAMGLLIRCLIFHH
jgi:hypothetical protein